MSTLTETTSGKTAAQASAEVKAIHRKMLRRQKISKGFTYLVAILIILWILVPIWFIASMALTTPQNVFAYPKGVLPFIEFSFETMRFFLSSEGIIPAPESTHAIAQVIREAEQAKREGKKKTILFNLSGHGLVDMAAYDQYFAGQLEDFSVTQEEIEESIAKLAVLTA